MRSRSSNSREDLNPILKRFNTILIERNISPTRVSIMAGLGTSTMSNLLKRNNMPSLPSLIKICVVLGIKVSTFFRELEFESPELFLVSEGEVQRFDPLLNRKNQIIEHFSSLPIQDKSEVMEKIRKNYPVDSNDKTKE